MTLRACTIVNFNTERFKLGKPVFQMVNFITREKKNFASWSLGFVFNNVLAARPTV